MPHLKIKKFITYLKKEGIVNLSDDKYTYLYSTNDGLQMQVETLLKPLYSKKVGDSKYHDNKNYILASLDNVVGFNFIPNGTRLTPLSISGLFKLNTYKSYANDRFTNPDITLWLEYLDRLFPDKDEQEVVAQYLAHMFQQPEQRPSYHLLLTSDSGTGKGFLFSDILTPLLSHQVSQVSSYSEVTAKHSACFDSTLLLMLDDPKSKSADTMTRIKSKLSEEYISIERKFQQAAMHKVYTRVILASNELRPLRLEDNERRWYAPAYIEHKVDRGETQQFILKLSEWLSDGGLGAVYEWLMAYSLEGFNHKHINQTATLKAMIVNSTPVVVDELKEFIELNTVFTWSAVTNSVDAPNDLLKKYITDFGYKQTRTTIQGKKQRLWHPVSYSTAQVKEEFTPTELF